MLRAGRTRARKISAADLLESAIIQDIKTIFRDGQFMARIWEVANKRLGAEKPNLEKEIARIDGQIV